MSREDSPRHREFDSTRWSVVLEARGSTPDARTALETLCRVYWFPLYAYVRRRGYDVHDSRDLTQEYFATLLEKGLIESADPYRGKFRAFLLTSMRNFLTNQWDKRQAKKRGGGKNPLSLDFEDGDSRYAMEPNHAMTPERLYERQCAIAILDHVMVKLREEFERANAAREFDQLKAFLAGRNPDASYAMAAEALGISESAATAAGSRLRKRYGALLREEIAQTLANPNDVDAELRDLFTILGS